MKNELLSSVVLTEIIDMVSSCEEFTEDERTKFVEFLKNVNPKHIIVEGDTLIDLTKLEIIEILKLVFRLLYPEFFDGLF
jgi:hypothetical protein